MSENKTSKYFKYAVGEIILVVIGILIALQINNWNQGRKAEALRIDLLKNLKVDLQQDLQRLGVVDGFLEDRKNYAKLILDHIESPPPKIDSTKVFLALERCSFVHTYDPPMPTYTEMQGSGNLSLLKSQDLKKALASYRGFIQTSQKIELRNSDVISEYSKEVLRYMDANFGYIDIKDTIAIPYRGLKFDLEGIRSDDHLKLLVKNVYNKSIVEQRYKNDLVRPRVERIIALIDEQLKDATK